MTLPITMTVGVYEEPEMRFSQSGNAWVTIKAIYKDRKKDQAGNWTDSAPMFLRVKAFGGIAENIANSVERGDTLVVSGKLQPDEWETKDGEKRTSYDLIVDEIGLSLRWATYTKEGAGDKSHSPSRQPAQESAQDPVPF